MTALEISRLDEKMLQLADTRSPKEISAALGGVITPARVATRIKELLETRDWLTDAQQDAQVVRRMRELLGKLERSFNATGDQIIDLDNAKVQLSILKAIGDRLDKRRAATDAELNALYENQASLMFEAIRHAVRAGFSEIRELHDGIDQADMDQAVRKALPEAVLVISEKNRGEGIEA